MKISQADTPTIRTNAD